MNPEIRNFGHIFEDKLWESMFSFLDQLINILDNVDKSCHEMYTISPPATPVSELVAKIKLNAYDQINELVNRMV